jgi:hypothetical protein
MPRSQKHDAPVAAGQDVFGRQQPLFDRRGNASLEQDGLALMTQLPEQRVVLHVPRADLEHVAVLLDQIDLADVHDFRDQLQILRVCGRTQHP